MRARVGVYVSVVRPCSVLSYGLIPLQPPSVGSYGCECQNLQGRSARHCQRLVKAERSERLLEASAESGSRGAYHNLISLLARDGKGSSGLQVILWSGFFELSVFSCWFNPWWTEALTRPFLENKLLKPEGFQGDLTFCKSLFCLWYLDTRWFSSTQPYKVYWIIVLILMNQRQQCPIKTKGLRSQMVSILPFFWVLSTVFYVILWGFLPLIDLMVKKGM